MWIHGTLYLFVIMYQVRISIGIKTRMARALLEEQRCLVDRTHPKNADVSVYAYHISIRLGQWEHLCSGAIISATNIITSASCFCGMDQNYTRTHLKIISKTNTLNTAVHVKDIESYKCHPLYNNTASPDKFNLAVIKIKGAYKESDARRWIRLSNSSPQAGMKYLMTAWPIGITDPENMLYRTNQLQYMRIGVIESKECQNRIKTMHESYFCAVSLTRCSTLATQPLKDIGSPLLDEVSGSLVGILSSVQTNSTLETATTVYIFNSINQHWYFIKEFL